MLHRSTLSRYVLKVIRHAVINDHGRLLEMLQNNSEPRSICNFQGWLAIITQNEPYLSARLNLLFSSPSLPLPLSNIAEMDTAPHEFLCKIFSCKPRLWGQALLVKKRASLLCSMAGSLNRKSSYQLPNWESKSMMAANPNGFWMPLGSDSNRLREKWFHIC